MPIIHEPDLRQYTHLGDAASKSDNRIFDPKLRPTEVKGDYSGRADDRWIFPTTNSFLQWNAIAALAAASDVLKGWHEALAKDCLATEIKAWNSEKAHPTPSTGRASWDEQAPEGASASGVLAASQGVVSGAQRGSHGPGIPSNPTPSGIASAPTVPPLALGRSDFGIGQDWAAALEMTISTNGAEPYKSRLKELFPQMITSQQMGLRG